MNEAQAEELRRATLALVERFRTTIYNLSNNRNNLFETYCFVCVVRFYAKQLRIVPSPRNLLNGQFRFRYSTNGHPWNYSFFVFEGKRSNSQHAFELRHNQKVAGAYVTEWDDGDEPPVFAVDVAVVRRGALPDKALGAKRKPEDKTWVTNEDLLAFGEVKNLRGYPMLLAQFLGTVHELVPSALRHPYARMRPHPPPVLFVAEHLTAGSQRVLKSFADRRFMLTVVEEVLRQSIEEVANKLRERSSAPSARSVGATVELLSNRQRKRLRAPAKSA